MTSGDVCLKTLPGSYMNHTLPIKSWSTVSMTIPNEVTVETLILLCSNWSNLPTLTLKTQLASMWSSSCNVQHLAPQQGQHKIQWLMLRKTSFRHFRRANMANRRSIPHDDVIWRIKTRVAWTERGSESWEHCAACDPKRSLRRRNDGKRTSQATKRERSGTRIMWSERPQWKESEVMTQRLLWCRSRNIWVLLKRDIRQPQDLK